MRAPATALHLGLAGLSLLACFFLAYHRSPEESDREVVVLDIDRNALRSVRLWTGPQFAEVSPTAALENGRRQSWVRSGRTPESAAQNPIEVARTFKGNDKANLVLEWVTPLRAVRALGKLTETKLSELGLTSTPLRLVVTTHQSQSNFRVSPSVAGLSAPYLLSESDGEVYLLRSPLMNHLNGWGALVDDVLHLFNPLQADHIVLEGHQNRREFVQRVKLNPDEIKLFSKDKTEVDLLASGWMTGVNRVQVVEVLGRNETPPMGEPRIEFRVSYIEKGKTLGHLEVARSGTRWVARTENTAGWVVLSPEFEGLSSLAATVLSL